MYMVYTITANFETLFVDANVSRMVQVVPQGIEPVNGSDVNIGCTSPLVDSGSVMICGSPSDCAASYLLDGDSPAIHTSTSDWASQLVTVRKTDGVPGGITFDHVLLTFGFDTAVSLTSIELDLLLCPEWNIGAPLIAVYGNENRDLVLRTFQTVTFLGSYNEPSQSSCDSLSTVSIPIQDDVTSSSYLTCHITVQITDSDNIEWFIVGEVRFMGTSADPGHTPSMSIFMHDYSVYMSHYRFQMYIHSDYNYYLKNYTSQLCDYLCCCCAITCY